MRELVSATFSAGWPVVAPGVPFGLENEGATLPPTDSEFFALLTITPTTSEQMTHGRPGNRKVRRNVWIQVKIWGPADTGTRTVAALGDAAQGLLEMVALPSPIAGDDPVTTQASLGSRRGAADGIDGRWLITLTRIPGWYMETK